jgi:hypothetical protein
MDVLVPSFNRPYYLDRCLRSLRRFASGIGTIVVLDDGTPARYLDEIRRRHPDVRIERSELADAKAAFVAEASGQSPPAELDGVVPVPLWRAEVSRASDPFLLFEDDMWLVRDIDLERLAAGMRDLHFATVKLALLGNEDVFWGARTSYPEYGLMEAVPPFLRRSRSSELAYRWLKLQCKVAYWETLKDPVHRAVFELATRSRVVNPRLQPLYLRTLYFVAGCAFTRDFWLSCWNPDQQRVWEFHQLDAALEYAVRHHDSRFGAVADDVYRTSYSTAATNRWSELGCDMNAFNRAMNEAWLAGELDGAFDREFDIDDDLVRGVLARRDDPLCRPESWTAWAERNRDLFGGLGYEIDGKRRPGRF